MEIPILGQGPRLAPVEQLSGLLDVLCDTLLAAKVAAEGTLPGSELAKALARAHLLKEQITPVLAGALAQVRDNERKRNREKALEVLQAEIAEWDAQDEAQTHNPSGWTLRGVLDKVSEALGGGPVEPGARA